MVELKSHTKDGSDVFEVSGEATPKGFRLRNPAGSIVAPAGLHTTNGFWEPDALNSKEVIDAQNGGVVGLVVERRGQDNIDLAGRQAGGQSLSDVNAERRGRPLVCRGRVGQRPFGGARRDP